jgi:sialidase-1
MKGISPRSPSCSSLIILHERGSGPINMLVPPLFIFALVDRDVFAGGKDGYYCYRLPNLVQLPTPGHLLAVAQAHKYDCFDGGWMDAVAKSSNDNGKTWSEQRVIYSMSHEGTRNVTIGTPTAVADLQTGAVHLFVSVDFKAIMLFRSDDGGMTWGSPRNMTESLVPAGWGPVYT